MAHLRDTIKTKFHAILTATRTVDEEVVYPTNAADRVYKNRYLPLGRDKLPAICLYALNEDAKAQDHLTSKRTAEVIVDITTDGEDADAQLDTICNQVEYALLQNDTLDGTVDSILLTRVQLGYDEDARSHIQAARLFYDVVYYASLAADPGDDMLETAHVEIDTNSGAKSEDNVTIPTT